MNDQSADDSAADDHTIDSLQSISRGASLFFVGNAVANASSFLFNLVLTRFLGAHLYGIYAYAAMLVAVCKIFTNLGSDKALLRYLPEHADDSARRNVVVGLASATSLGGSLVAAAALYTFAPTIATLTLDEPLLTDVLRIFALIIVFETLVEIVNSTFRALELLEYQVLIAKISQPLLQLIAVVIALVLGYSLLGAMAALVVATIILFLVAVWLFLSKTSLRPSLENAGEQAAGYYNFSVPLTFKDMGQILYARVDIFMVGLFLSSTVVGIYNIAVLVAGLLVLPLTAFNQLFPPIASRLYSNGKIEELESVYKVVTRWTFTVSLLLAVGAFVYRTELLAIFGEEFTAGAIVLTLFILGQLTNCAAGPSGYLLMMTSHQYVLLVNQWGFGLLNVVLNYYMILNYGMIGAAAATASVLAALNVVRVLEIWYLERLFPYSWSFVKPLVAGAGALIAMELWQLYLTGWSLLIVGGATGTAIYGLALLLMGFEERDKEFFRSVWS